MDGPDKKCVHCSIPCVMRCSKCCKVGYCGVEHQKLHWKIHKKHCFPAIELKNETYGHHLVSTRKILAGEVIFTERPLIVSPFADSEERFPVCLGCSKVLPGQFGDGQHGCQKCSWPLCKPDCEKISNHSENECKLFQIGKVKPSDIAGLANAIGAIYDCIKIIRILLLKESDPGKFGKILQLESHGQPRQLSSATSEDTSFALTLIYNLTGMDPLVYRADLINKLLGIVFINSCHLGCSKVPDIPCESYIFEKSNKLSHSCISNTRTAINSKSKIRQVFAATDIEKDEMLTECHQLEDTLRKGIVEKRQSLNDRYHFWCSCPRCSDPTELGTYFSAIKCKGKNCSGFYLPRNPLSTHGRDSIWKCNSENCRNTQKYAKLFKVVSAIQNEIKKSVTVREKLNIIQKHANVSVHENHFTLVELRYGLLPHFRLTLLRFVNPADSANPEYVHACSTTIEFAEKCLEIANKLAPGLSLLRGVLLYYLAHGLQKQVWVGIDHESIEANDENTMSVLKGYQALIPIREEAKRILEICPEATPGHTLYKSLVSFDKEFNEALETLENEKKRIEMGNSSSQ